MRHEPFTPMDYKNQALMDELNDFAVALKIWLYPELFEDRLPDLQRQYPKPKLDEIDHLQARIHHELSKDAEPFIKR